jgi:hypothetical protein
MSRPDDRCSPKGLVRPSLRIIELAAQHLDAGRNLVDALDCGIQLATERFHDAIDARVCRLKAFFVFRRRFKRSRYLGMNAAG